MPAPFPPFATVARIARPVLIAVLFIALFMLGALGLRIQSALVSLRSEATDNIYWNLSQLEVDLVRLGEEIRVAALMPEAPLTELRRRHDLFYSRAQNVIQGKGFGTDGLEDLSDTLGTRLARYLDRDTPLIDGPDQVLRQNLPAMSDRLSTLREDLRQTSIQMIDRLARLSDGRRAAVSSLVSQLALATAATIGMLGCLLALVVLLNRAASHEARQTAQVSRQLTATVDSALEAIIVIDDGGRILRFNPAAEAIFGYSRDEVTGLSAAGLILPAGVSAGLIPGPGQASPAAAASSGRFQTRALHRSGASFPVELSLSAAESGEGTISIAFLRDISDRLAAEAALTRARDEALAAERAKTEFLAVMSHEMRTPLNGVLASLEIAAQKASDPEQAQFIALAKDSAHLLLRHANDLLDITRMESGGMTLADEDFDLHRHLSDLVEMVRPICTERGIALEFQMLTPGARLHGDPFRLGQIVQNFLSNAIKFVRHGGITVEAEATPLPGNRRAVEVRVIDTGPGIAPADQERIFQDFVMLDPSFRRSGDGAGLGLAIARRLAQAMGGEVGVESTPGEGSCFWLRLSLPLAQADDRAARRPAAEAALPALDVLVVEDNATNRAVMDNLLRHLGQRVVMAVDGEKGAAAAAARRYDLILMDISMPVMDGLTATRLIRSGGASSGARIVAVTAHSLPEDLARFRAAGMEDVLVKPISRAALAGALAGVKAAPVPQTAPAEGPLDAARLAELRAATGDEAFSRLARSFLHDARALTEKVLAASAPGGDEAALTAACHEAAGLAAIFGAGLLRAHYAQAECDLHEGRGAAARNLLLRDSAALLQTTEAAVTALL